MFNMDSLALCKKPSILHSNFSRKCQSVLVGGLCNISKDFFLNSDGANTWCGFSWR